MATLGTNNTPCRKSAMEAMPGTKPGSDICKIYDYLASHKSLTTLDAVFRNNTVCLTKYISIMRDKYGINIKDEWVRVGTKQKRVKRYWLED
jgi:hypothetical protein